MTQALPTRAGLRRSDWLVAGSVALALHGLALVALAPAVGGGGGGGSDAGGSFAVTLASSPLASAAEPLVAPASAPPRPARPSEDADAPSAPAVASAPPAPVRPVQPRRQPPRPVVQPPPTPSATSSPPPAAVETLRGGAVARWKDEARDSGVVAVDGTAGPVEPSSAPRPLRPVVAPPSPSVAEAAPDGGRPTAQVASASDDPPLPAPRPRPARQPAPDAGAGAPPASEIGQAARRVAGGGGGSSAPGVASEARAGASGVADLAYLASVSARLARVQRYPQAAQRRGQEGQGRLALTIANDGRLLDAQVVGSTGATALDREMGAMARRAAPFDPPPGGTAAGWSLVVPVQFRLR